MSTLNVPKVRALAGFSIRELLQDLTILQEMVSANTAAHGYQPAPDGIARLAVIKKRERAISNELRHRLSTGPPPPNADNTPVRREDTDDITALYTLRDRGQRSTGHTAR